MATIQYGSIRDGKYNFTTRVGDYHYRQQFYTLLKPPSLRGCDPRHPTLSDKGQVRAGVYPIQSNDGSLGTSFACSTVLRNAETTSRPTPDSS